MLVIHICRKPLSEPTVSANVLKHGTGALNIDACRIGAGRFPPNLILEHLPECLCKKTETVSAWKCAPDCPIANLDKQSLAGGMHSAGNKKQSRVHTTSHIFPQKSRLENPDYYPDKGGASRFFKQVGGKK